jgi:hypothetical protein
VKIKQRLDVVGIQYKNLLIEMQISESPLRLELSYWVAAFLHILREEVISHGVLCDATVRELFLHFEKYLFSTVWSKKGV